MQISTKEMERLTGVPRDTLSVWLARHVYQPADARMGGTGVPRVFSRRDAKHLYFIHQLTLVGMSPGAAARLWERVSGPADLYGPGGSGKVLVCLSASRVQVFENPTVADLPPVAVVVRVQAVFDAIDAILDAEAATRESAA